LIAIAASTGRAALLEDFDAGKGAERVCRGGGAVAAEHFRTRCEAGAYRPVAGMDVRIE
jgi:hypothetical protein